MKDRKLQAGTGGASAPPAGLVLTPEIQAYLDKAVLEAVRATISPKGELSKKPSPAPLLSVDTVAARLSVSRRTVESLIQDRQLVPIWVRGVRRFTEEAVGAYLRRAAGRRIAGNK